MNAIESNSDILDGTPVFRGTRIPVQTLLDYIENGDTLDEFLADFPTVSRQQVVALLESAGDQLLTAIRLVLSSQTGQFMQSNASPPGRPSWPGMGRRLLSRVSLRGHRRASFHTWLQSFTPLGQSMTSSRGVRLRCDLFGQSKAGES